MNSDFVAELSDLLKSLDGNLSKIQSGFETYQNNRFEQKKSEFFCLELNGEAGELANLEKKSWKGKLIDFSRFEDEAADVLIALINYCNAKGISLEKSVIKKLQWIENKRLELENSGEKY